MNIFNRKNLSVSKTEVILEYRNMSDKKLMNEVVKKFSFFVRSYTNTNFVLMVLMREVPFTRKQSLLFLEKLNTHQQTLAYAYRHLVRCAYFYGVPRVIINNYIDKKEDYETYQGKSKSKSVKGDNLKKEMRFHANTLMSATTEMIHRSKSRKSKINNLMDKINDKEINI